MSLEQITDGYTNFIWWKWSDFQGQQEFSRLHKYSVEEVTYHTIQCKHHGFFVGAKIHADGGFTVIDLSPEGHEFLENIRDDKRYGIIKDKMERLGASTVNLIKTVAAKVIAGEISDLI
jgi:hypothetical protein